MTKAHNKIAKVKTIKIKANINVKYKLKLNRNIKKYINKKDKEHNKLLNLKL